MANFFTDNEDIQFLFDHLDLESIAEIQEAGYDDANNGAVDFAPTDAVDMVENYRLILELVGEITGEMIARNAEQVDREGNTLNDDGTVTLHPLVQENLRRLSQGDLMGFTLPRRYGGLNCPNIIYTMATEMVARADVSLMNMFGLQGIAETINAFANQEIRDEYLPGFCTGEYTGAMVLTEPDAGSDLQAVRLRAEQDADGNWVLNGVKRFITNGCGEVLLVLARSEAHITDGRGLSLFITERCDKVKVRHLENKLGIHGSPTCELVFNNCPCRLIGERKQGLISYVMALMNGARVGIAAQGLGCAEAAYRLARTYAASREQFGVPIEQMPAVAEMITDMKVAIEAARTFTYHTCTICDRENNNLRMMEMVEMDADEKKARKKKARTLKRLNAMMTPMSKYVASEMSCWVTDLTIQVLGGSGYMQDYAAERYFRDSRITTIYEGTSQLQVLAASRGVSSGQFENYVTTEFEPVEYADEELAALKARLVEGREKIGEAVAFVKQQSTGYLDLAGRRLVDSAMIIIIGHMFLAQADKNEHKRAVTRRYINMNIPKLDMYCREILEADQSAVKEYELIAGPVPAVE